MASNEDAPAGAVTPPGLVHPHDDEGEQMDTTRIEVRGDAVLNRVLVALMSDEQLEHALNGCRDNAADPEFAHAARILEREARGRLAECPKCFGSGSHYVPDPNGWSSLKRREPEYIVCDGCGGSGRVPR